jgi:L-fuculose-phosphate aldolase
MLLEKEREQVVEYGKKLITSGLTKGTGGNISVYNREAGLYAISPSGIDYFSTDPEDVVVMNLAGEVVEGTRKPSSEWDLHRIFYQNREELNAIVHTHSVYCTVLATNREGLPASSYLVAFAGKDVRCAKYASFGTPELAREAYEAMEGRNAVLLANHGLVAGGSDLLHAFQTAEQIEFCAEVYVKARSIGKPVILPEDEMERMIERFCDYGQKSK